MKILKKISAFLIILILCVGIIRIPVFAASSTQDGLEAELNTDKESYTKNEEITALLTVTNTSETAVEDISLEHLIPEGYRLASDSEAVKETAFLNPGESISLETIYAPESVSGRTEESGGDNKNSLASSDAPETSVAQTGLVNTGDQSEILPWIVLFFLTLICLVVMAVRKKKTGNFLALVLAVSITGTFFPVIPVKAEAADSKKVIEMKTVVQVEKESFEIDAVVKYNLGKTGIPEGDSRLTREDWITGLSAVIGLAEITDSRYSYDDFDEAQSPNLIESAVRSRFVLVEPDEDNMNYFRPKEYATREFAAYTAVHALNYQLSEGNVSTWADSDDITYPKEAVTAVNAQILSLVDNKFLPNQELSLDDADAALRKIAEIIKSTEITGKSDGNIVYADGVQETELIYELDELDKKVFVTEPEKIVGWQAGEVHALFSGDSTQKDIAIKIVNIAQEDGWTVIHYEEPAIEELVVSFEVEGTESTQGEFIPAEGVIIGDSAARAAATGSVPLFGKKKLSANIGDVSFTGSLDLKELEYRFSASPSWHLITINEVYLAVNSSIEFDFSYMNSFDKDVKKKIGSFKAPLGYGFNASGDIYLIFKAEGGVELGVEISQKNGIQYTKNNGIRPVFHIDHEMKSIALKAECKGGLALEVGAEFLGIDLVTVGTEGGLAFEGTLENISIAPMQFCLDGTTYLFMGIYARIGWDSLNIQYDHEILNSDNSLFKNDIHFEETGIVQECTRGSGNYEGYVKQAGSLSPIERAKVQVYQGDRLKDITYTDNNGKFVGIKLKSGSYKLRVSSQGYRPYEQNIKIIGGQTTTLEPQLMVAREHDQTGTSTVSCAGTVTDAHTGQPVAEATVVARSQQLGNQGQITAEAKSDGNGSYRFNVPAGNYELAVSKEGYTTNYKNVSLSSDDMNVHISLNSGMESALRAVLHWGAEPADLDSHMVGPQGSGRFHVLYSDMNSQYVSLDVDDTTSYGPETISIIQMEPGIYSYYVHDYTNRYSSESSALSRSGAYVELYTGDELNYTFYVPQNKNGTLWHVFDYDSETFQVKLVNQLSYESEPGNVGGSSAVAGSRDTVELKEYELQEQQEHVNNGSSDDNDSSPVSDTEEAGAAGTDYEMGDESETDPEGSSTSETDPEGSSTSETDLGGVNTPGMNPEAVGETDENQEETDASGTDSEGADILGTGTERAGGLGTVLGDSDISDINPGSADTLNTDAENIDTSGMDAEYRSELSVPDNKDI